MEKVLTISLSEYEDLKQQLEEFKKAQKDKDCILVENDISYYAMGGYRGNVKIYTKDELIINLQNTITNILKEKQTQSNTIRELRNENTDLKFKRRGFFN